MTSEALRGAARVLPLLLPGGLLLVFGFSSGGYFARTIALGVVAMCAVVAIAVFAKRRPEAGFGPAAIVAASGLALLAGWAFASEAWSDAPGRALFEFDRTALYLLAFVAMVVLVRGVADLRWVMRGILVAVVLVAGAGLISRILPELWPTEATVSNERLSFPLTYWNALGAVCSAGFVLAFAMTSDLREPPAARVAAAAALPVLAATLLFTFSRASMLFGAAGLVLFLVVSRSRGALSGLLVLPSAVVAIAAAYNADALSTETPTTPAAIAQGGDVAVVVVLCIVGAAIARFALLRLDGRVESLLPRRLPSGRALALSAAAVVAIAACAGLALGGAGALERQYDAFVQGDSVDTGEDEGDLRSRLSDPGNNGRREQWGAAVEAFGEDRLKGLGAGTYILSWSRHRESQFQVEDAHSLYVEMLGELGVIGLLLVVTVLGAILTGLLRRARGSDRTLYAGLFAATVLWALLAGVDWHWEMPSVTAWVFAAAGAGLAAAPVRRPAEKRTRIAPRVAVAVACLLLAVTPARVAQSEFASRDSKRALARGDCSTAISRARDSIETLSVTPEPHEIAGYCHLREGRAQEALAAMRRAVVKDPRNWRVHYGLSVTIAVAGGNPRPEMARARELNPLEPLAFDLSESFAETNDPRSWRRRALGARLPSD